MEEGGNLSWRMRQVERRVERLEGLDSRLAVLESGVSSIRSDVGEIKTSQTTLQGEIVAGQRGMSRPEKIALTGTAVALMSALLAAVALLVGGTP